MRDVLIVLVVLGVAAVLFLAAVVATQEGEVLVDAPPDRPDVDLPAGHVVAEDLRSVRFGMVFRGYRMSEVDEVLDRLGGELAERDVRIADLERALVEVVEPAVQEAEARHAASPPAADEAPEPALPPSLAPPLARGARDGEAPAEAPAPAPGTAAEAPAPASTPAGDEAQEPALPPSLAPPLARGARDGEAPAEAPAPAPASAGEPSPLDPGWEPSTVERTLDLAASYRFTMPVGPPPVVPETEPEPAAAEGPAEPEAARTAVPEEELDFPEVEPAEPGTAWAPEARDDTGDEGREQRATPQP